MFRKMRRSPQALTQEEIIEVLKNETRGVLSVQGDDGYPYGVPINHYYDEETGKLYFHGANFGHRVGQEYQKEGDWAKYVKSVIVFGKAELIEDQESIIKWSRLLCGKFPCTPEYVESEIEKDAVRTLCFAIEIENINGKLVHEA